ncbi:MAG: hypothetical protein ISR50_04715 [Alphaproteobacteria bacterium]|nr:hypothetical protein [Alphaproteobacteria bacterium]
MQGLQGPQGLEAFLAAQGLHGLQAFLAAQGLHGLQAFLAAHGLQAAAVINRGMAHFNEAAAPAPPHGLQGLLAPQGFLAAQGLHGLQAFLAAQGLQAPQPFFLAAQGLQAANCSGVLRSGAAGALGCWPLATATGLTPPLALLLLGTAANAISANGIADPAAMAAPMTRCNTDAVKILFLVKYMLQPPGFSLFVGDKCPRKTKSAPHEFGPATLNRLFNSRQTSVIGTRILIRPSIIPPPETNPTQGWS